MERFQKYQQEAQLRLGKAIDVQLLMEPGDPVDEIVRLSNHSELDLLIMGTRGAASESENVFGSVTATVVNRSHAPVLAIPESARYRPINHIMYATTFREEDQGLIEQLLELASAFSAHLSSVHVEESDKPWYQMEFKFLESIYQHRSHWHLMRFFNFSFPDIEVGLNQFIRETNVDLVAVLSHHHGMIDRVLGKEFSRDLLLHTHIPMLSYPSPV
jgi:nucleotide-binding universal stress UspA family protein